jgi:hypothetical protein
MAHKWKRPAIFIAKWGKQ